VIRDAKGRKWFLRFKRYQDGFQWDAQLRDPDPNIGRSSGTRLFATRADAEADAGRSILEFDQVAHGQEFFRRLQMRGGTVCQLTAADLEAIDRAGKVKP
jgi:hypothetical protein